MKPEQDKNRSYAYTETPATRVFYRSALSITGRPVVVETDGRLIVKSFARLTSAKLCLPRLSTGFGLGY